MLKLQLGSSNSFNLDITLCCGQAFRWNKHGKWWIGVVNENVLKIRQVDDCLEFENANVDFVRDYFGLDDDLPRILSEIRKDEHIRQAVDTFSGLRILRQDPWECLISYICATFKNIPAIKQMLYNISKKFGEKISFDGLAFYTFPTSEKLSKAKIGELVDCGLGFRAKYVSETAKIVYMNGFSFDKLKKMSYEDARKELLGFWGVGLKVADCVLLFSLGKLEAFPVDVWIRRAILKHYSNHFPKEFAETISNQKSLNKTEYEKISLFGRDYFGKYAGYAQEYLYHYERTQC